MTSAGEGAGTDAVPFRQGEFLSISQQHFHPVAYTEWGAAENDRVVICLHGLSRQGRDFDALASALVREGYRVVCPDLVGRGRSGRLANPDEYALPQYAVDMTMLIARLRVRTVDWIGTSLGGLVGIVLAGMPATPIRRLVVNDIGAFVPWAGLRRIGDSLRAAPRSFPDFAAAEAYMRAVFVPFGPLTDAQWRHFTEHSVVPDAQGRYGVHYDPGIAEAFRPGRVYNVSLWTYWDAICCPTLLLRGVESDLLDARTAVEMTRRGPKATLVEFPECGHAPALMDDGQIAAVTGWMAETAPD